MVNYVGIITTQMPSLITDRVIRKSHINAIKVIVAVNSEDHNTLRAWRSVPNITLIAGYEHQSAGYSRNLVIKYLRLNSKGTKINLLLLDDDMLPSLASYQTLKNIQADGIYVPLRREYINGKYISSDFRNTLVRNHSPITRIGGAILIVGYLDCLALYPNDVTCEEETIFCLKNILQNQVSFRHSTRIRFTHFGKKNSRKSLTRFVKKPRGKLLTLYIVAILSGHIKRISFKEIFQALK